MRLHLYPSETRSLELLTSHADVLRQALAAAAELLGTSQDTDETLQRLVRAELEAGDLHYALLTHLRSSFVNVLPREDLYDFSRELHAAVSAVAGTGPLLPAASDSRTNTSERLPELLEILYQQADLAHTALGALGKLESLEEAWLDLLRLASRARRAQRDWLLELAELPKASAALRRQVLVRELGQAVSSLQGFADRLGHVLVKES